MGQLVKSDIPNLLLSGLRTEFMGSLKVAPKQYDTLATVIESNKSTETYAWLGSTPSMHEWKDERIPQGLLEHNYSIKNRKWESSIAVDQDALDDEQYGQTKVRIRNLAEKAVEFYDKLAFTLIGQGTGTSGTAGTVYGGVTISCYDGKAYFATNHSEGESGSQSNRGSTAISTTGVQAAITAMNKFKDDKGENAGVDPNLMVVSPDLQWTAKTLLQSQYVPEEGTTTAKLAKNVLAGSMQLLVNRYLTDATDWYLFDTAGSLKPLIMQMRKTPEFTSLTNNTESTFMRDKLFYGIKWRGEILWGDWRKGYASIVSN
jgi:phage major head subunit gpT-like protein